MAMDAKDLRIESALGAHGEDGNIGNTKYGPNGTALQTNGNKPYHDIGSNSLAKVDVPTARPCAIIGPDRVVPPQTTNDAYLKKVPVEPWPYTDSLYQHPPEYPHKPMEYQPSRNISPRQTFQENMQRIMVPPSYTSVKNSEDHCLKNPKLMPLESKFCDVPYTVSPINNEPKSVKSSEGILPNNNYNQPVLSHGWASSGVNVRPLRPYGAPELFQYSEYPNYPGPRPISMIRPHRNFQEDVPQVYQDRFYHEANVRFKPYPTTKERPLHHPQARYEYIPNYPSVFHPHAPYQSHKYDLQKSIPSHPYSVYPPVPLKYLDRRMPAPVMEKFSRSPSQQVNFNPPFCNQNISSTYGSVPGNCLQNRAYPYAPDSSNKHMIQNRIYYDSNNTHKHYTNSENMYINDINRPTTLKNDPLYPSYPPINMHSLSPHHMYRKEGSIKGHEQALHYKNIEYSANINSLGRLPLQFLPQSMSMSSDSNTSNDTTHTVGNARDDFGYVSQSSTASIRSIESGVNRVSNDIYRRYDMRHEALTRMNKSGHKLDTSTTPKDKKDLDVRQFLQMWNEGDDEGNDNKATRQRDSSNSLVRHESANSQEQLYVLDLVHVPNEELAKYDHIQKISKLPENIKGYNNIEILNQYEKLVESSGLNQFSVKPQSKQKDLYIPMRNGMLRHGMEVASVSARPISPLDVESKISQSVIHKDVGCNFEIRPCSPQMMNVELATPVHNVLGERLIEKVVNSVKTKSPLHHRIEETSNKSASRDSPKVTSCKMANNQYPSPNVNDSLKTNYCLQDLEGNSGVCLASLPRLDNDIELNFPEINQQFINANKISIQDLPTLDTENGGTVHKNKSKVQNQAFVSENLHSGSESDKEVSKLSKYRKHKRNSIPNESSETTNVSLHRTDSVIIKNPENIKSQEEYINLGVPLVTNNTDVIENIVEPINMNVESDKAINYSDKNFTHTVYANINNCPSMDASDTAIDFSINKIDDEQTHCTNSLNNLSGLLQNNLPIDRINSGTTNRSVQHKLCTTKISKLEEFSATDNFAILHPPSSVLGNLTSSSDLNNTIELQAIDEAHETVITRSIPKDLESDILVSASSTEKIGPHLSSSSYDTENVSKNINTCNSNITENRSTLNNDIENQVLNYCLSGNTDDGVTPACDNYNLVVENQKDHISVTDIHTEDDSYTQTKENTLVEKDDDLETDIRKNNVEDLAIQESECTKMQTMHIESKMISDTTSFISKSEKETFESIKESKQDVDAVDFKIYNNVGFTNEYSDENKVSDELTAISEGDCSKPGTSTDIITILINDFNSTKIPSTEMDVFEKNKSFSESESKNTADDIKNSTEMSASLINKKSKIEKFISDAKSNQIKYESVFKKELFSSRFQNLLIHEGFCTSLKSYEKEIMQEVIDCLKPSDNDLKISIKPILEENAVDPDSKSKTNTVIISNKIEETVNEAETDNSTEFVENKTVTGGSKHLNRHNIDIPISLDKEKQNEITTNVVKDIINSETNVVHPICDSKTLLEVAENNTDEADNQENNEGIQENNVNEIHVKFNDDVKENISLAEQSISNLFPNRLNRTLKRSLSESAVHGYTASADGKKGNYDNYFKHGKKRQKIADSEILVESQVISENFTSFIQNNRRNSISTIYNDENVSFCIVIDNDCVLTEENENSQKICYTELSNECLTTICTEGDAINSELPDDISYKCTSPIYSAEEAKNTDLIEYFSYETDVSVSAKPDNLISELDSENTSYEEPEQCDYENDLNLQNMEESWVEDVACIETVFNDDVAEDIVISAPSSPKFMETSDEESDITGFVYNVSENEHTNKVKYIYGNQMCDDDAQLVEKLYRTPQMDVNKTLTDRESQLLLGYNRYYDTESLEKILSESNTLDTYSVVENDSVLDKSVDKPGSILCDDDHGNKENLEDIFPKQGSRDITYSIADLPSSGQTKVSEESILKEYDDCLVHSCEYSCDNLVSYKKEEKSQYAISSSPEVSSTTEEKAPGILLKIRSYKGTKISEVNEMNANFNHTHPQRFNNNSLPISRPLLTKAAQKYIPPLKDTIRDLKVKIRLPKQSLYKLQQLKNSKEKPKIDTSRSKYYTKSLPQESQKKAKPKPKFEDVLMSIDEIQFKKHKEKNRKTKQSVPKVIIKKNENGAHYASTQTKEPFNPDLTGRKWQPWVFLEKSNFVDKMALKQKFKAIYSHRKKTFVLAENFRKYKSISNAKFVISHPKSNDNISTGKLKYTFRLKHT